MARMKAKQPASHYVRETLREHPDWKNAQVVLHLKREHGIAVKNSLVSRLRHAVKNQPKLKLRYPEDRARMHRQRIGLGGIINNLGATLGDDEPTTLGEIKRAFQIVSALRSAVAERLAVG